MVTLVLSLALALAPHSGSQHARQAGHFPSRGVFVPGVSLAGVKIGDTQARVQTLWGRPVEKCGYCADPTWLYMYKTGEPLGAAARFQKGKVVAVFTLGSPAGWKTNKGLFMGDGVSDVYNFFNHTSTTRCIGFDAIWQKVGKVTVSFYSAAGVVYGFAMTIPGMTVCQ